MLAWIARAVLMAVCLSIVATSRALHAPGGPATVARAERAPAAPVAARLRF